MTFVKMKINSHFLKLKSLWGLLLPLLCAASYSLLLKTTMPSGGLTSLLIHYRTPYMVNSWQVETDTTAIWIQTVASVCDMWVNHTIFVFNGCPLNVLVMKTGNFEQQPDGACLAILLSAFPHWFDMSHFSYLQLRVFISKLNKCWTLSAVIWLFFFFMTLTINIMLSRKHCWLRLTFYSNVCLLASLIHNGLDVYCFKT